MFPFVPDYLCHPAIYAQLVARLPDYARMTAIVEAYFSNLSWFGGPIDRAQVSEELIPIFYPKRRPLRPEVFREDQLHDLALCFSLLVIGSVADLTQDAINFEAEELEKLARAALGLRSIFTYGTLEACQALILLGSYETCTRRKMSNESADKLMTFGLCVASSVSLSHSLLLMPNVACYSLAFVRMITLWFGLK